MVIPQPGAPSLNGPPDRHEHLHSRAGPLRCCCGYKSVGPVSARTRSTERTAVPRQGMHVTGTPRRPQLLPGHHDPQHPPGSGAVCIPKVSSRPGLRPIRRSRRARRGPSGPASRRHGRSRRRHRPDHGRMSPLNPGRADRLRPNVALPPDNRRQLTMLPLAGEQRENKRTEPRQGCLGVFPVTLIEIFDLDAN